MCYSTCRYLWTRVPLLLCQDSRSYPWLRHKELGSRTPGVRLHITRPTVPDPLPAQGWVRCRHVARRVLRATTAGGPGPPMRSRTPVYCPDPSPGREQTPRLGGPEPPRVLGRRHARTATKLPQENSPSYFIQYGRRQVRSATVSPRRHLAGCTVDRALPRYSEQPLAPPTPCVTVCYAS